MSLFNRPAWASAQSTVADETAEDLFSHSTRSYRDIIADDQRRKREAIERQKGKQERKQRRISAKREVKEERELEQAGSSKRRRITVEESEDLADEVGLAKVSSGINGNDHDDEDLYGNGDVVAKSSSPRRSPRKQKTGAARNRPTTTVVELDDDSDENFPSAAAIKVVPDPIDSESDDDFAILAERARARRRLEEEQKKMFTPDTAARSPTPGANLSAPPDPIVKLLVTSRLEGSNQLVVMRKLSQRLQEVREAYCKKQGWTPAYMDTVYLTYRGRRVYDVSTCRSLGLDVDMDGKVTMKGVDGFDDLDRVHLEAVTEGLMESLKAEKAQQEREEQQRKLREEAEEEFVVQDPEPEVLIRIVLKAKGRADHKIKVRPVCAPCTHARAVKY